MLWRVWTARVTLDWVRLMKTEHTQLSQWDKRFSLVISWEEMFTVCPFLYELYQSLSCSIPALFYFFKKKITSMMLHVMVYFWHQWRIDHICPLSLQCQPITSYFQSIPPLQHISTVINYSERTNNSHLLLSSISMSHYVKHSFTENISVHTFMISQKLVHIFGQDTESCASTVTVLFF